MVLCQNTIDCSEEAAVEGCMLLGMGAANERKRVVLRERFCCSFSLGIQAASVRAGLAF